MVCLTSLNDIISLYPPDLERQSEAFLRCLRSEKQSKQTQGQLGKTFQIRGLAFPMKKVMTREDKVMRSLCGFLNRGKKPVIIPVITKLYFTKVTDFSLYSKRE